MSRASVYTRYAAATGLVLIVAYIIVAHWLTFNPFRIDNYVAIPDEECMGIGIQANLTYTLEHPRYGEATRYTGTTYWEEANGTGRTPDQQFSGSFDVLEAGTHTITSPVIRLSPPDVGEWTLVTELNVFGQVLLFPRNTNITHISGPVLTTLPADHPRCLP